MIKKLKNIYFLYPFLFLTGCQMSKCFFWRGVYLLIGKSKSIIGKSKAIIGKSKAIIWKSKAIIGKSKAITGKLKQL